MKNSNLAKTIAAVALAALSSSSVLANPLTHPGENDRQGKHYEYVKVTGSAIPQKVEVKSIGTATTGNLRVIGRNEIDKTGRYTTAGAIAQDPSTTVRGR